MHEIKDVDEFLAVISFIWNSPQLHFDIPVVDVLKLALRIDSIATKGCIECITCINSGLFSAKNAELCTSEIRLWFLARTRTENSCMEEIIAFNSFISNISQLCLSSLRPSECYDSNKELITTSNSLDLIPTICYVLKHSYNKLSQKQIHTSTLFHMTNLIDMILETFHNSKNIVRSMNLLYDIKEFLTSIQLKQFQVIYFLTIKYFLYLINNSYY